MTDELSAEEKVLRAQDERRQGKPVPIDLPYADLSGLHLPSGDLVGANLEGADLTGAILAGAFLSRANLKNAILVGASLDGADLTDCDLRGADLAGARIDDAVLANAHLEGACLQLVLGDPLSMNGAVMDRVTLERSEFTMRDIAQMVVRGAYVHEHEEIPISRTGPSSGAPDSFDSGAPSSDPRVVDTYALSIPVQAPVPEIALPGSDPVPASVPVPEPEGLTFSIFPSNVPPLGSSSPVSSDPLLRALEFDRPLSSIPDIKRALASLPPSSRGGGVSPSGSLSLAPSSRGNSIIPSFRAAELTARIAHVEQDQEQMPVSQRMFLQLNALIEGARIEAAPVSLRPAHPAVRQMVGNFSFPLPGDTFLGVSIEDELPRGTTARGFRGKMADGTAAIVRVFDPHCDGAALQLPAFQRGLRALNKLQGLVEKDVSVVELLAVASDQTAYVVRSYPGQSLRELVEVSLTLKAGLDAICSLAKTVAAIHRHGVLVRSWKPSNVLVEGYGLLLSEPDMVHLSTLAQYRGDAGGYRAYAAPEELLGRGTRSPTADVFSLGKMLEFLLTGVEPLVPLGSPPLIAQRENVPQVLVDIVRRATAQEPVDRYQQVDELLEDLLQFQKEGERAVLMASLRPAVVSQLSVPPLTTNPEPPDIDALIREKLKKRAAVEEGPPPLTWHRQAEVGAALLGGLGGTAITALMIVSPTSVDGLEGMGLVLATLFGLVALGLPVPTVKRLPYRLATWAGVAALIWLVDPLALAQFTWHRQLGSGSAVQKQDALRNLSRLGKRDAMGANLDGGPFANMDLASMNFTKASLKNADFTKAFLVEAKFDQADVTGARFEGANLFQTTLSNANGYEEASCDRYTKLPAGLGCQKGFITEVEVKAPQPEETADNQEPDAPRRRTSKDIAAQRKKEL